MSYWVYILLCADGSYYVGSTHNLERRMIEHHDGGDMNSFTYTRRPVILKWSGEFPSHDEAFRFERQIKGWSRAKKEALILGNWDAVHAIVSSERKRRSKKCT